MSHEGNTRNDKCKKQVSCLKWTWACMEECRDHNKMVIYIYFFFLFLFEELGMAGTRDELGWGVNIRLRSLRVLLSFWFLLFLTFLNSVLLDYVS